MADITAIPEAAAVVVVIGGPEVLVEAARSAAGVALAARVETCTVAEAATAVSTHRPLAIVMSDEVFGEDGSEFEALARDVQATLVRVDASSGSRSRLERKLMPKLGEIARKQG